MRRRTRLVALAALAAVVAGCVATEAADPGSDRPVRILVGEPATLDPARQGDAGSAAITAQLFESITAIDADLEVRPALAASWVAQDGGRRIVFTMRPDLEFSDGTPLRASDVVRSWLRLIDPAAPSPLATLLLDVAGAAAYVDGTSTDPGTVGLTADDGVGTLTVDLTRPATDFPAVVAGPSFAVVPPGIDGAATALEPGDSFVASGGYTLAAIAPDRMTLHANENYWAGRPAISTIELVTTIAGGSPVEAFEDGELDYAGLGGSDASWIAYDATLGPRLIEIPSLIVEYYGFDTSRPPFDDVRVRQAVGMAVDWRRMAALAVSDDAGEVATSMVPPGIPGRSEQDFVPPHDPERARSLLAEAGYPGGRGFPATTLLTNGGQFDEAVVTEIERELGVRLAAESMAFGPYTERLLGDPPAMWSLAWVADYPGRNDFLGVLLGTGATNNYGRWSSAPFDRAIAEAGSTTDEAAMAAAYDRAEAIVRDEVPVVPLTYGAGWALVREGLLGAGQNGLAIIRMAGLAWAD